MAIPSSTPLPLTGDNLIDAATHGYYWQLDSSRTINWALADGFAGEFWTSPQTTVTTLGNIFDNISYYANVNFHYVGYTPLLLPPIPAVQTSRFHWALPKYSATALPFGLLDCSPMRPITHLCTRARQAISFLT